MKRIISLIMSVLMIATMFCSLVVVGNADGTENYATNTVELIDNGDGTYTANFWTNDETVIDNPGFFVYGVNICWDEDKLEMIPVANVDGTDYYVDLSNMLYWTDEANVAKIKRATKSAPSVAGQIFLDEENYCLYLEGAIPCFQFKSASSGTYKNPVCIDVAYMEDAGIDTEAFIVDAEKGLLMATCMFQPKAGATGTASVWTDTFAIAVWDGSDSLTAVPKVGYVTEVADSIDLGGATEPEITLEDMGINLAVQDGASIRTADPAGMRFTTIATSTNENVWADVQELGTAIVVNGTTPGVDTTLTIPARVNTSGEYLQAYDSNKVFSDGVTYTGSEITYTGVLSNIKDANKAVEFTAYAYAVIDGVTYYSESSCTRSYDAVAEADASSNY
ncbi:MAG: hypothetical protein IJ519_02590 [Clostridia bacterium]|nr:hypothetical protein [Clostridia bacterium]